MWSVISECLWEKGRGGGEGTFRLMIVAIANALIFSFTAATLSIEGPRCYLQMLL